MKLMYIDGGKIVSTHGVRGEVKILPWVDSPEFLLDFSRVRIGGKEYQVEQCRVQKTCNLVKLAGVDTVEAAQLLRDRVVQLYREDAPADLVFAAELLDMPVFEGETQLGVVKDVLDYPGNMVYVVQGTHTYMIPAVKAFVLDVDLEANRMQVKTIEGMRNDEI